MSEQFNLPKWGVMHNASAEVAIAAFAKEIEELEAAAPEKQSLVVTMQTPDGRTMLVESIKPVHFSGFLAKGYIDNLPCSIIGHISTLNIFCAYEAGRGKTRVGFILDQSEAAEPQQE